MKPSLARIVSVVLGVTACVVASAQEQPTELLNHGPVYANTIKAVTGYPNVSMKGLVVKMGTNDMDFVCYDEDLLRVSVQWTGAFLRFQNNARERIEHPQPPDVAGSPLLATRPGPGWSLDAGFADPRAQSQGPLPRSLAKYRGVYVHGDQAVVHYTVGGARVLELPAIEEVGGRKTFVRTIELEPTDKPLYLRVADTATSEGVPVFISARTGDAPVAVGAGEVAGTNPLESSAILVQGGQGVITAVVVREGPAGLQWDVTNPQRLALRIPALKESVRLKLLHWTGNSSGWKEWIAGVGGVKPSTSLESLTHGGPARWEKPVVTRGTLGTNEAPYVVDVIGEPFPNPWKSRAYLSGFDFLPDGRAYVSAFHGDVWMVSGLDAGLSQVRWRRFAAGLFQPLGLKWIDGVVYVTCRDQITRLHDLNKDGEADYYENFNNDTVVTPNYHEFSMDLQRDSKGNLYYAKGAPWPPNVTSPHQGTMLRVSPDGQNLDVIATGLRAPNGMGMGPNDEITVSDNEGHWIPSSKINLIKPGKFYGMVPTAHRPPPTSFEAPICWLPKSIDNSSGGQVWVEGDRWGPLKGSMLFTSYGRATLFSVLQDQEDGVTQAGVIPWPLRFNTGVMRMRFNGADGQLYLCGLRGWQTSGTRDGGFFRVRYTGRPANIPVGFKAGAKSLKLRFSDPVEAESAKESANWSLEQWNYVWSGGYGSPEVSTTDPSVKSHERVEVAGVEVSADGKEVTLGIPALKPVMQMRVRMRLKSQAGGSVQHDLYLTLHKVP